MPQLSSPSVHSDVLSAQVQPDWGRVSVFARPASEASSNSATWPASRQDASERDAASESSHVEEEGPGSAVLQSLWADCAGLLILYFACIPKGGQVSCSQLLYHHG